jgi:hypothetical protein
MWLTWIAIAGFIFCTIINWLSYRRTRRRIFQVAAGMTLLSAALLLIPALWR